MSDTDLNVDLPIFQGFILPPPTPLETLNWHGECLAKIRSFQFLKTGWDSYDAPSPNAAAQLGAEQALLLLIRMEFRPDRVAPSVEGGIAIAWRREHKDANIEFFNSGEILTAIRDTSGLPVIQEYSAEDLEVALGAICDYIRS